MHDQNRKLHARNIMDLQRDLENNRDARQLKPCSMAVALSHLFHFTKELGRILVEFHDPDFLQRNKFFGDDLDRVA